jgi:DNA-binding HxlR family transcriptional regulator
MTADRLAELMSYLDSRDAGFDRDQLMRLAYDIRSTGNRRVDPVREIMSRLGDRWSALIISILATGRYRHAALRRVIAVVSAETAISQRMLTLRLRALERDGLVMRDVELTVPPTVCYSLSPLGGELAAWLAGAVDWIKANEAAIHQARADFEASQS